MHLQLISILANYHFLFFFSSMGKGGVLSFKISLYKISRKYAVKKQKQKMSSIIVFSWVLKERDDWGW